MILALSMSLQLIGFNSCPIHVIYIHTEVLKASSIKEVQLIQLMHRPGIYKGAGIYSESPNSTELTELPRL